MSTNIKTKKRGDFKISYMMNKKIPLAQYIITWKTNEEGLLRAILRKFISEKVLLKGVSYKNNIINACVGKSGIMILGFENKFFAVINQIYYALLTTTVKISGNYNKLISDISKGCNIYVTGKIPNIIKNCSTNNSKKIENFKLAIDKYDAKSRDSKGSNREEPVNEFELSSKNGKFKDVDKYALSFLLSNTGVDFWFSDNYLCTNDLNYLIETLGRANFALLKTTKFRYGAKDKKAREFLDKMFSILYNFNYAVSDFLKTQQV